MKTKHVKTQLTIKEGEDAAGSVSAVVSTFGVIDSDGDIVQPSAFTEGQETPMVWSHDWNNPVGKGVINVEKDRAVFNGQFFLETNAGREAYATVKAMAGLQEWSWGFNILESSHEDPPEDFDGELPPWSGGKVQLIERTEVFEVSPVLVGANRATETLAVKNGETIDEMKMRHRFKVLDGMVDEVVDAMASLRGGKGDDLVARLTDLRDKIAGLITEVKTDGGKQPPAWHGDADEALDGALEKLQADVT